MKGQGITSAPPPHTHTHTTYHSYRMFSSENYLNEPQDTELRRTITNFTKESKDFKENANSSMNLKRIILNAGMPSMKT